MKKTTHGVKIGLVIVLVGLLMGISACKKKTPEVDPMEPYPSETEMSQAGDQQAAGGQTLTEEELQAQRLREEEARNAMAAETARLEAAKAQFVNEDVYFNFDDATLSAAARQVLQQKAAWLRENPGVSVLIEGHCDERGTAEYNIALGQRRAESVKNFLVNAGIAASRLTTVSYGEERPVDFGHNESAWAKNRRAHFRIQN